MATDQQLPAPGPRPSAEPPLTEHSLADRQEAIAPTRIVPVALAGSVLLAGAVALSAMTDSIVLVSLVLAGALIAAGALLSGFRSFAHIFLAVCAVRPLVDLSAGPRGEQVSLTELYGVLVLIMMVLWLAVNRHQLLPRLKRPLPIALLALVAVHGFATLGSVDLVAGLASTLRISAGVVLFLVTDLLLATRRIRLRDMVFLVVAVSAVPLLYPVMGLVGLPVSHEKDGITALKSVFYLSNNFAYFLVPLLILGAAWALRSRGTLRLLAIAYTAVVAVELVFTETRGAWFSGALGVLIVCLLLNRRVLVVALAAMLLAAVAVPSVNARLTNLVPDPDEPRTESSFAWRVDHWERLLPAAKTSPLLGGGPNESARLTGKQAHNDYVRALVETGALGLAAYLAFLVTMVATGWQALRRVRGGTVLRDSVGAAPPLVVATMAGIAAYVTTVPLSSSGDNLIDNVTLLWSTLPLVAVAQWALLTRRRRLALA